MQNHINNLQLRAIFNLMSKVMRDYIVFALLCSVTGPENLRQSLNQSDVRLRPIMTISPAFSRAQGRMAVFKLSSYRPLHVFSFLSIDRCDDFGFSLTTLHRKEYLIFDLPCIKHRYTCLHDKSISNKRLC